MPGHATLTQKSKSWRRYYVQVETSTFVQRDCGVVKNVKVCANPNQRELRAGALSLIGNFAATMNMEVLPSNISYQGYHKEGLVFIGFLASTERTERN